MNHQSNKALYIIVNAGFSDEAVSIARMCGARGATIINARGTGSGFRANYEPEKEIIVSIVDEETAYSIMKSIKLKAGTNTPANGICYCLPIDRVSFINKIDADVVPETFEEKDVDISVERRRLKKVKVTKE